MVDDAAVIVQELILVEILDSEILCVLMMIIHSYKKLKWFR